MAFGQQSGPPATARQLKELMRLLEDQGYTGFRDARGPLGFTQRQGGGKFTAGEADEFIEQLQNEADGAAPADEQPTTPKTPSRSSALSSVGRAADALAPAPASSVTERREARQAASIREMPAKILAKELERRDWVVIPPPDLTAPDPTEAPPSP